MSKWTHKGLPITVNDNGEFTASMNDVTFTAISLAALRSSIDDGLKHVHKKRELKLPVIGVLRKGNYSHHIFREDDKLQPATLVGLSRSDRSLQLQGLARGETLSHVIADTPANRALMQEWLDAQINANRLDHLIHARLIEKEGYGRIDPGQYENVLRKLEAQHKASGSAKK